MFMGEEMEYVVRVLCGGGVDDMFFGCFMETSL
jgi:hypothetical protein